MQNLNSIFVRIKENVSAEEVAGYYGLHIKKHMAVCPFHSDKNPSLKLGKRFYCFACGAKGDVIDYVSKFFNISSKEAAIKIGNDFGIPVNEPLSEEVKKQIIERKIAYQKRMNQENSQKHFFIIVSDYYHMLKKQIFIYSPSSPDEEMNDLFVRAVHEIPFVEYIMDCYLEGTFEERNELIQEYKGELTDYEKRVKECQGRTKF